MASSIRKPLTGEARKIFEEWLNAAEPYDTSVIVFEAERDDKRMLATIAKNLLEADDKLKTEKET